MKKIFFNKLLISAIIISVITISLFSSKILLPFFVGAFVAYLLNPLLGFIERKKINSNLATLLILISFYGFILIFSLSVLPIIIQQTIDFLERFPNLVKQMELYLYKISKMLDNNIFNFDHVNILKDFHDFLAQQVRLDE